MTSTTDQHQDQDSPRTDPVFGPAPQGMYRQGAGIYLEEPALSLAYAMVARGLVLGSEHRDLGNPPGGVELLQVLGDALREIDLAEYGEDEDDEGMLEDQS